MNVLCYFLGAVLLLLSAITFSRDFPVLSISIMSSALVWFVLGLILSNQEKILNVIERPKNVLRENAMSFIPALVKECAQSNVKDNAKVEISNLNVTQMKFEDNNDGTFSLTMDFYVVRGGEKFPYTIKSGVRVNQNCPINQLSAWSLVDAKFYR